MENFLKVKTLTSNNLLMNRKSQSYMSLHRWCWPRGAQRILHMASLPRAAVVQCSLVSIVRLIKDVLSRLLSLNQKWWMLIKWLRMEKKLLIRHIRDIFLGSARCNTTQTYRHPLDGIFYFEKEERQGWRHSFKFPIYISEHMVIFTFLDFLLKRTCKENVGRSSTSSF